jgi:two-component system, LytTR family, response regulator
LRAILVDDERLALRDLRHQLAKLDKIAVIGEYTDPADAEEAAKTLRPELAFLDIEMPGMNGIELAERLIRHLPALRIVFVTAYDEYAVKAFELNAMDYVLKPAALDRLKITLDRVEASGGSAAGGPPAHDEDAELPQLRMLQKLELCTPEPVAVPWRTAKTKELFAYLLLHRGRSIHRDILLDVLWPDTASKRGYQLLFTTIYLLRRTINAYMPILELDTIDIGYRFNLRGVRLDSEEWERSVDALPELRAQTLDEHMRMVDAYRGDLLAESDYGWAEGERQRLRNIWFRLAMGTAEFLAREERLDDAMRLSLRITSSFPYAEDAHFLLMRIYRDTGDHGAVKHQYELLERICQEEYGIDPKEDIKAWYTSARI